MALICFQENAADGAATGRQRRGQGAVRQGVSVRELRSGMAGARGPFRLGSAPVRRLSGFVADRQMDLAATLSDRRQTEFPAQAVKQFLHGSQRSASAQQTTIAEGCKFLILSGLLDREGPTHLADQLGRNLALRPGHGRRPLPPDGAPCVAGEHHDAHARRPRICVAGPSRSVSSARPDAPRASDAELEFGAYKSSPHTSRNRSIANLGGLKRVGGRVLFGQDTALVEVGGHHDVRVGVGRHR